MPEFSPVVLPFNDETAASLAAQNMMPPTRSLMAAMMDFSCSMPPLRWGQYKTELRLRLEDVSRVEATIEVRRGKGTTQRLCVPSLWTTQREFVDAGAAF